MVGEIDRIGGPDGSAARNSLVANHATNSETSATISRAVASATKSRHYGHREWLETHRLDVKPATSEWGRQWWRRSSGLSPMGTRKHSGHVQAWPLLVGDCHSTTKAASAVLSVDQSRCLALGAHALVKAADATIRAHTRGASLQGASTTERIPCDATSCHRAALEKLGSVLISSLPAAKPTDQYEDIIDLTHERSPSKLVTLARRRAGRKPPARTASSISLISSAATPFWGALMIFLVIIISLNDSNHCYCQLGPTRGQQQLSGNAGRPWSSQDGQRQQQQQQPIGRGFKRRRTADLVQQLEGVHVALGRNLPRAAAMTASDRQQQQQQQQLQQQHSQQHAQEVMPYKTFYVTQACEWKSNLFVPKSNDIHFAQQRQPQQQHANQLAGQAPDGTDSRTILSTSQKALVLALPISLGQNFAGYEPACSIRLVVPRNMRILAKLTARRLTFEQEQVAPMQQAYPSEPAPGLLGASVAAEPSLAARGSQLWLNVSQNQFSETEQKIIETEGNVLAFRFLLERFANKQAPEIRFQVVLTAFQTLAENSDFNQPTSSVAWQPSQGFATQPDGPQQNAQFICDSQRLISANLACDGFKNCQDGHDEEPATCLALRNQQTVLTSSGPATSNDLPARNQQGGGGVGSVSSSDGGNNQQRPLLTQLSNYLTRDLAGFLIGLLLLLLLLVCCACCCHCLFLLLRRLTEGRPGEDSSSSIRSTTTASTGSMRRRALRRRLAALRSFARGARPSSTSTQRRSELGETDSLARDQNIENAARLKARSLLEPTAEQPLVVQPMQQQQLRVQSILKRPTGDYKGAPLARFEAIPHGHSGLEYAQQQQSPPPPPPRAPSRHAPGRAYQPQPQPQRAPSPRRGALASSMTDASRSSGRFAGVLGDFRPTPAARASGARSGLPRHLEGDPQALAIAQQRQQTLPGQVPFLRSQQPQEPGRGPPPPTTTTTTTTGGGVDSGVDYGPGRRPLAVGTAPPPTPDGSDSDRMKFKSKTTKLEQTSTITGGERVTVYQYSSNLAQFSESYLLKQGESSVSSRQRIEKAVSSKSTTTATSSALPQPTTSGSGDDSSDKPPELPPKSRQSSLI